MPNVKFITPSPYSQKAAELDRRQKMAELLQQQAMEPMQQQAAGGKVIPISPLTGLTRILQSYTAQKQLKDLGYERAKLEQSDIDAARKMAEEFSRRSTEQPIAEGDNTLRELAVRPIASSVPGKAYRTELVEPALTQAERQASILPAALGAGVGPYQQKLAELLYTQKPEAPKGSFAPINWKDVDVTQSDIAKYRETGNPAYLVIKSEVSKAPPTVGGMVWNPQTERYEPIPGYEEQARRIAEAGRAPSPEKLVQVEINGEGVYLPESQAVGKKPYVSRGAEKVPAQYQSQAASFSNRMENSNSILNKISSPSIKDVAVGKLPVVGNFLLPNEAQSFNQAAIDFITAQLRKESGATITPQEIETGYKNYIPLPGDGEDVKRQKEFNRKLAVENMQREAGPAYKPSSLVPVQSNTNAPSAGFGVATRVGG